MFHNTEKLHSFLTPSHKRASFIIMSFRVSLPSSLPHKAYETIMPLTLKMTPDKVPSSLHDGIKVFPQSDIQRDLTVRKSTTSGNNFSHLEALFARTFRDHIKPDHSSNLALVALISSVYSYLYIRTIVRSLLADSQAGTSYSLKVTDVNEAIVSLEVLPEGIDRKTYWEWDEQEQELGNSIHGKQNFDISTDNISTACIKFCTFGMSSLTSGSVTSATSITLTESSVPSLDYGSASTPSNNGKKRTGSEEDNDRYPSDSEKGKAPKQPKIDMGAENGQVRLACPYRKHNSVKYSIHGSRVCAMNYWLSVSRIKEHLYRVHRAPIQCRRCGATFKTESEHDSHITALTACSLTSFPPSDGITGDVERKLRSRKQSPTSKSEAKRWENIYRILFPNDEDVPEPYFEPIQEETLRTPNLVDLNDYELFSRREYPNLIRSALRTLSPSLSSETWVNDVAETIQNCHQVLLSSYRAQHVSDSTSRMISESDEDALFLDCGPTSIFPSASEVGTSPESIFTQPIENFDIDFSDNFCHFLPLTPTQGGFGTRLSRKMFLSFT
ncbi:hypothetical protein HYALB_00013489 [Hymenoscyphus albidus]|uniref:C2H2-type domain-containing protein n=1 Tax=Hymenoscyphus albidus TaxID=595503 RepID=A0A9N9LR16_9HELO|nr:hypothetical protein HYALB_00013489 [Hymenoscyphus albidus]